MRGRPKIEAPTYQVGDVLALHFKNKPDGRRIKVLEVSDIKIRAQTTHNENGEKVEKGQANWISLHTARPTANGWHLVERGGLAVRWDAATGKVVST
jgi:hypothetical protein